MNFVRLCNEVGVWSEKNFGRQGYENPAEGFLEELGEFAHAHLKMKQGIRGTTADHREAMKDAIGDSVVFLADFCSRADIVAVIAQRAVLNESLWVIEESYRTLWRTIPRLQSIATTLFKIASEMGHALACVQGSFSPNPGIYIESIVCSLMELSYYVGVNFSKAVEETWETVSQRDWAKNRLTGQV